MQFINLDVLRAFLETRLNAEEMNGNVLEIGHGLSTDIVFRKNPDAHLCEPRPRNVPIEPFHKCKLEDIPTEYNFYYDVVACIEVLEHVERPWKAAAKIEKLVKPGGTILVSSPYSFQWHGNNMYGDYWRFHHSCYPLLFENCVQDRWWECPSGIEYQPVGYFTKLRKNK